MRVIRVNGRMEGGWREFKCWGNERMSDMVSTT
jgi:hypothetical protein